MRQPIAWVTALVLSGPWVLPAAGQREPASSSQVEIVQTVGCASRRGDGALDWWLTRATEPTGSRAGVFDRTQVEDAQTAELGSREFQLVGVPDFLDREDLLSWGDRASFTTPEQANATGELRDGATVLVKGLHIELETVSRINLLAVVRLAESCR